MAPGENDDRPTIVRPPVEPSTTLPSDLTTFGAMATAALRSARPASAAPKTPIEPRGGDRVEGRYTLVERIGEGAQGEVWTAHDRLLGERVALKWLGPVARASAHARREIAVLRMLRVPGVVQLVDEGVESGRAFVVMEHVEGAPFPGAAAEGSTRGWASIERTVLALLETLGRVHAAGVVHRDLKPANVLVRPDGQPVVLDFGISHWSADGTSAEAAGTPAYMAPEQIDGGAVDARADLYAVGAMLHEALSGAIPHRAASMTAMLLARRTEPAPPLAKAAPGAPSHVAAAVDRLLALRADDRFRSAAEVIAALRGAAPAPAGRSRFARRTPFSERALRSWFAGPDRIFHLREDAARALWEVTSGVPARVEAEIDAWERLGLARRDRDEIAIDRAALGRLSALRLASSIDGAPPAVTGAPVTAAGAPAPTAGAPATAVTGEQARAGAHRARAAAMDAGDEGRLYHLLSAGDRAAAAAEALATGRARAERGDLAGATEALVLGLSAHRGAGAPAALETGLLSELVKVALVDATPGALDRALYEISRAEARTPEIEARGALVRAALDAPGAGGIAKVSAVPPFDDPSLERRRHRARVIAAAARTSPALIEEALADVRAWAARSDHPMAALSLAEGTALLRYAEGRYAEAALLHAEAARLDPWITGRLAALLNAASALMEAFDHRSAKRRAREARALAAERRFPHAEARAEWLLRAARYRAGEALAPDVELVEVVTRVGVAGLTALVCLNEAAVALRAGDRALTSDLADRAARIWKQLDRPAGTLLATALAVAASDPAHRSRNDESRSHERTGTDPGIDALCEQAITCSVPGIGLQALGLLCAASPARRRRHRRDLDRLAAGVPPEHRSLRMDVLSADEAVNGTLKGTRNTRDATAGGTRARKKP